MHTNVPLALMAVVERSVRPVRVSHDRKRRMREELLAQITASYEDERARCSDEWQAFDRARIRFGDPSALAVELARDVPRWNRLLYYLERLRYVPHESAWRFAGKHFLIHVLALGTAIGLVVPATLLFKGRQSYLSVLPQLVLVLALTLAVFSGTFVFLVDRISRARWGNPGERSVRATLGYCVAALSICPAMITFLYAGLGLGWPHGLSLLGALLAAPLLPLLLLLISRQAFAEICHEEQWGAVEVAE